MSFEDSLLSLAYASIDFENKVRDSILGCCSDRTDNLSDYVAEVLEYFLTFEETVEYQISQIEELEFSKQYKNDDEDDFERERDRNISWLKYCIAESSKVSISKLARLAVNDWFEHYEGSHKPSREFQ